MRKSIKILIGILLSVALLLGATFVYVRSFSGTTSTGTHDCAVVFGAAVWPGGSPSHALEDRTLEAIDLYKEGLVKCLIFSGAQSAYGIHEVDVMNIMAKDREVEDSMIVLDYEGVNTLKTIQNLDPTLSYIFVSNDFHLARIALLARKLGLTRYDVYASEYRNGRYGKEMQFVVREVGAFWYYALTLWGA